MRHIPYVQEPYFYLFEQVAIYIKVADIISEYFVKWAPITAWQDAFIAYYITCSFS